MIVVDEEADFTEADYQQLRAILDTPVIFEWDGEYDKRFYYVHLPSGETVECWPNAGIMNSTDGSGRAWYPEDRPRISYVPDDELPYRRNRRNAASGASSIHATGVGTSVTNVLSVYAGASGLVPVYREPGKQLLAERKRLKRLRRKKR